MEFIFFTLMGFCLGSTLFAYWIPKLLKGIDIRELPEDHNPGVANAYLYGNFWLGTLALFCELGKGFFPVFLSQRFVTVTSLLFVPVMAAPVLGHACPFFHREKGGKAIAVSFGVMLGLYPVVQPLFYLVLFYLLFSLVLIIRPHSRRTIVTFILFSFAVLLRGPFPSIKLGCFIISAIVVSKHVVSRSTNKAPHVRPL